MTKLDPIAANCVTKNQRFGLNVKKILRSDWAYGKADLNLHWAYSLNHWICYAAPNLQWAAVSVII